MANKQINELTELTTASGTDLVLVYDLNEAGSEKTKKMQIDNFPGGGEGAASGWVLVETFTLDNEAWDKTFSWDGADRMNIVGKLKTETGSTHNSTLVRFNGDTGNNYTFASMAQNGGSYAGYHNTGLSYCDIGSTGYNGFSSFNAEFFMDNFTQVTYASLTTSYRSDSTGYTIAHNGGHWNNSGADVTSVRIYSSGGANCTGTVKVYKWID